MGDAIIWILIIGGLIAAAALLGKWNVAQAVTVPKADKKKKQQPKASQQQQQEETTSAEGGNKKKDKKKQKKQAAKSGGGNNNNNKKQKVEKKAVAPPSKQGGKRGVSRAGAEEGLPSITQQLAARKDEGETKKKKKVNLSAFHPYFSKEKKSREPAGIALQFGLLYRGTEYSLEGCINDLKHVHEHFLRPSGFRDENIICFTDDTKETPTRRNMESSMKQFVANAIPGDRLFLQYSGHGTAVKDRTGDEKDGFDEAFCPLDGGVMVDDWVFLNVVKPLERTPGVSLFVLVDACHSGTCLDLQNQYYATRGTHPSVRANLDKNVKRATTARVIGFSAAMDNQTATDVQGDSIPQGAFTEMFLEVFRKHVKKPLTYRQFLLAVDGLLAKAEYAQQASISSTQKINLDHECRFW